MAPTNTKRDRGGDPVALQSLKARHREEWPTPQQIGKYMADMEAEATEAGNTSGTNKAAKGFADFIYRFHDKPHTSRIEWWYVNGHVGTNKATNTAYSFFAAFFRLHIMGDHYAYAVNWALTEAPALKTQESTDGKRLELPPLPAYSPAGGRTGTNTNTGNYYTFASQDPITPMVIDTLMTKGKFNMADPRVAHQVQMMARNGQLPSPDKLFTTPAVCRGSDNVEVSDETLYVEIDGCVFSAVYPKGAEAPTYTMKLVGTTANGDGPETTSSLEMTFSPNVAAGNGPLLQGKQGVVSVDNFEDDMFYYCSPRCSVTEATKLTINGESVALTCEDGEDTRVWIDHEFSGLPPQTPEETEALDGRNASDYNWDWVAAQVPGLGSIAMAIVREPNPAIPPMIWGAVLPEYKNANGCVAHPFSVFSDTNKPADDPSQPIRIAPDTTLPTFNSPETGLIFPTGWIVHIPSLKNLRMRCVSAIPQQEFINLMAKPSYLEGKANIDATWTEADGTQRQVLTGLGFIEARGTLNVAQIEQIVAITHATVFAPAEMQPAPPAAIAPMLPAAILPQVSATINMMMQFAPPPKPKPNQCDFIAATLATYVSLLHYGSDEASAARFMQFWVKAKQQLLYATELGKRSGVKEIGMAAMMQKELEGIIVRKVPSVVAAAGAGTEAANAAVLAYIFGFEKSAPAAPEASPATECAAPEAAPSATGFDPSAIVAMAAAAGITIPPELAANPTALIAMAKAAGIPIPDAALAALGVAPPTTTTTTTSASPYRGTATSPALSGEFQIPTEATLATPSTAEERAVASADMTGKWAYCTPLNVDSVSDFLGAQGVNFAVRMFAASVKPTLESAISEEDGGKTTTKVHLMVGTQDFVSNINGKPYEFNASGRGMMQSRACLLNGGKLMAQRNQLPCNTKGIEYKFFDFMTLADLSAQGLRKGQALPAGVPATTRVMRETSVYYSQEQVDAANKKHGGNFIEEPIATLQAFYLNQ